MTAFNTVRFKVKPGREQDFLDAHAAVERNWAGLRHANIIDTGEGAMRSSPNGTTWTASPRRGRR